MKKNKSKKLLNTHWVSALVIILAISAPWFNLDVSNHSFVKSYIASIGIALLVLASLWIRRDMPTIFTINWLKLSWISLFLLGTLSIFWSVNIDFTISKWLTWFAVLCAYIVGYHLKSDNQNLIKFSWGLLIAAFLIALIGILQYWFDPFSLTQAATPSSTFGNKNMATQPLVLILPLALFLLSSKTIKGDQAWIVAILSALVMLFVFYTRTRSSWLSILIEIILIAGFMLIKRKELGAWISWDKNKTKASWFALGIFLLLINFNDQGFRPFFEKVINAVGGASSSGNLRLTIFSVAIDMIKASPVFGTGLGSWFDNEVQGGFGTYNVMTYKHVHNDLLELGVELGLVGIALLLTAISLVSVGIFKILNQGKGKDKGNNWFYFLLWVALSGSFIQMQFSFPYQLAMPTMLLGLYIGVIVKRYEDFSSPIKSFVLKIPKTAILSFWLVLVLAVSVIYVDWINTYNQLDEIKKNNKVQQIQDIIPKIYHLDLQKMLRYFSNSYLEAKRYDEVMMVERQSLKYWPNYNNALYYYAYALIQKKRYPEALKVLRHFKQVSGRGLFTAHILEMNIYRTLKQSKKFKQAFIDLLNTDEHLLALNKATYRWLLRLSLSRDDLNKYSEKIYNNYIKYHSYSCVVELDIARYYSKNKQHQQANKHNAIINNSNDKTCLK
ncbi:Oligosaccharide repeat unit polymerase Wzy [uncultured Candidatus Thioglobus sp.]|nr:Oligosaccharide repeat unit polymerase Wzy [uncultured Candidatus Thioglobus sp.]